MEGWGGGGGGRVVGGGGWGGGGVVARGRCQLRILNTLIAGSWVKQDAAGATPNCQRPVVHRSVGALDAKLRASPPETLFD